MEKYQAIVLVHSDKACSLINRKIDFALGWAQCLADIPVGQDDERVRLYINHYQSLWSSLDGDQNLICSVRCGCHAHVAILMSREIHQFKMNTRYYASDDK